MKNMQLISPFTSFFLPGKEFVSKTIKIIKIIIIKSAIPPIIKYCLFTRDFLSNCLILSEFIEPKSLTLKASFLFSSGSSI